MSKRALLLFIVASIVVWVVACCLPALNLEGRANTQGEKTTMDGLYAFILAIFAMFEGQFAWLANPLGVTALVLTGLRCYRASLIHSVLAVGVAQQTWLLVGTEISTDEAGVKKYLVTSLGLGFFLWVVSFVIIVAMAISASVLKRREMAVPPPLPPASS